MFGPKDDYEDITYTDGTENDNEQVGNLEDTPESGSKGT